MRGKAEVAAARPDLLPGLISAMRANPLINDAMEGRYSLEPIRQALARHLGNDNPHLDVLAELVPAIILHRTTLLNEDIDPEAFTGQVLRLIAALALDNIEGGTV